MYKKLLLGGLLLLVSQAGFSMEYSEEYREEYSEEYSEEDREWYEKAIKQYPSVEIYRKKAIQSSLVTTKKFKRDMVALMSEESLKTMSLAGRVHEVIFNYALVQASDYDGTHVLHVVVRNVGTKIVIEGGVLICDFSSFIGELEDIFPFVILGRKYLSDLIRCVSVDYTNPRCKVKLNPSCQPYNLNAFNQLDLLSNYFLEVIITQEEEEEEDGEEACGCVRVSFARSCSLAQANSFLAHVTELDIEEFPTDQQFEEMRHPRPENVVHLTCSSFSGDESLVLFPALETLKIEFAKDNALLLPHYPERTQVLKIGWESDMRFEMVQVIPDPPNIKKVAFLVTELNSQAGKKLRNYLSEKFPNAEVKERLETAVVDEWPGRMSEPYRLRVANFTIDLLRTMHFDVLASIPKPQNLKSVFVNMLNLRKQNREELKEYFGALFPNAEVEIRYEGESRIKQGRYDSFIRDNTYCITLESQE